jgi:hypothetical protein
MQLISLCELTLRDGRGLLYGGKTPMPYEAVSALQTQVSFCF